MPNYVSKLTVDNVLALIRDTAAQTLCANLRSDLTAETSARESADVALGGRIDAETSARESADVTLGGRIDAETSARESADIKLEEKMKKPKDRIFFLFGDSLFDGYDPDSNTRHGWGYWLKQYLENKGYTVLLATDITTTPYGSAFGGQKSYLMHLNTSIAAHPEYLTMGITDVIVYSGTNDANNGTSSTEEGISNFVSGIKSHWKNANIKIGFLSARHDSSTSSINTLFREKCGKYGCEYIKNGYALICDKSKVSSDNVHLTTAGYEYYSPYLCEGALSGNIHYVFTWSDIAITTGGNIVTNRVGANIIITDDKLLFKFSNIGGGAANLYVRNLGGVNPGLINGSFNNPTVFDPNSLILLVNNLPLYNESTGELLGTILCYFGSGIGDNNISFHVYGSTANSKCEIYATEYAMIQLN